MRLRNKKIPASILIFCTLVLYTTAALGQTTYYLQNAGTSNAQTPGNWKTDATLAGGGTAATNFTTSGDIFILSSGLTNNPVFAGGSNAAFGSGVTLNVQKNFTVGSGNNITTLTINGTIVFSNTAVLTLSTPGGNAKNKSTFTLASGATLKTAHPNGIDGGSIASLTNTARQVLDLNTGANYEFNGTTAQTTTGLPATVNTLTVNNASGVTLDGAVTVTTLTIGNTTSNSIFNDNGNQIISTGTLNLTSGTLELGSSTTATTFPAFSTRNISAGTFVEYASGVAQTVSTTPAYQNLTFSGSGTKTVASGTLSVNGNWAVGSEAALNVNNPTVIVAGNISGSGNITSTSGTLSIGGNWTNSGTFIAGTGTVNFNGSGSQTIPALNYYNLTSSSTGARTLANSGIISISGTFTKGTNSYTVTSSTVSFNGSGAQTIPSFTFNNLTITGAADTSSSNYKTEAGTLTVNGILTVAAGNTLNMSTFSSSTFGASSVNYGKIRWAGSNYYVAGTGVTEFYGSSATTIAPGSNYGNIIISGSGTNAISGAVSASGGTASVGVTVNTNLTVSNTGTLTITGMDLVKNGSITNNGIIRIQ